MKKIRIKVPKGLNKHAVHAWDFINVCAHHCAEEAETDYDFQWLVLNLYQEYQDEYKFLLEVTRHA